MLSFKQFINENDESFHSAEHLRNHFHNKYPGVDVQFHDNTHHNHSTLSMIHVSKEHQRKGIGTEVMKSIGSYADKHKRIVTLSPEKRPNGPSKSKLESWYKSHGFVHNKGRNKDFRFSDSMIRMPNNE